jgi:hypothetical protein
MQNQRIVLGLLATGILWTGFAVKSAQADYSYNAQYACSSNSQINENGAIGREQNYLLMTQLQYPQTTDAIAKRLKVPSYCRLADDSEGTAQYLFLWAWDYQGNGLILKVQGDRVVAAEPWLGAASYGLQPAYTGNLSPANAAGMAPGVLDPQPEQQSNQRPVSLTNPPANYGVPEARKAVGNFGSWLDRCMQGGGC